MKSAHFQGELRQNGQIAIPPEIASQIPNGTSIRVALKWGAPEEDDVWREAGRGRFEAAYVDEDSVYEALVIDPSLR
jgi:hypothetical protein